LGISAVRAVGDVPGVLTGNEAGDHAVDAEYDCNLCAAAHLDLVYFPTESHGDDALPLLSHFLAYQFNAAGQLLLHLPQKDEPPIGIERIKEKPGIVDQTIPGFPRKERG
jgi:hypothetical protein